MAQHLSREQWLKACAILGSAALTGLSMHFAYTSLLIPPAPVELPGQSRPALPAAFDLLAAAAGPPFKADVLVSKPLFAPGRSPPAAAPPPAPPPPPPVVSKPEPPPPSYAIGGIVISTATRRVLLRTVSAPSQWVTQGDTTKEGWMVVLVNPEKVVLRRGKREISLSMPGRNSSAVEQIAAR